MIETTNRDWGFWGTVVSFLEHTPYAAENTQLYWELAIDGITSLTECSENTACSFLDSTYGRHFADRFLDKLYRSNDAEDAMATTIVEYDLMPVRRSLARDLGSAHGMRLLRALLQHFSQQHTS
jgi:hypothetical protein